MVKKKKDLLIKTLKYIPFILIFTILISFIEILATYILTTLHIPLEISFSILLFIFVAFSYHISLNKYFINLNWIFKLISQLLISTIFSGISYSLFRYIYFEKVISEIWSKFLEGYILPWIIVTSLIMIFTSLIGKLLIKNSKS